MLTSRQLAQQAGVSYRKIDYWSRIGLLDESVPAKGSGSRRKFEDSEARVVSYIQSVSAISNLLPTPLECAAVRTAEPGQIVIVNADRDLIFTTPDKINDHLGVDGQLVTVFRVPDDEGLCTAQ